MTKTGRHSFSIARIGRAAKAALAPGSRGAVLAVFRRSFYAELDGGALTCIGPIGMGAGPLNALAPLPADLDWRASGLAEGAMVLVEGPRVIAANRFEFGLDHAEIWTLPPLAPDWSREAISGGLDALRRACARYDLSEGLARLVVSDEMGGDALVARGLAGARALRDWIADGAANKPPSELESLIGLGPGLTPSGDDFIGAAMIALAVTGRADLVSALASWTLPIARERTGKISLAHLSCAAEGEGAEALHAAIAAVAANDSTAVAAALAGLDAIGHSSGWDALAGAATVMEALSA